MLNPQFNLTNVLGAITIRPVIRTRKHVEGTDQNDRTVTTIISGYSINQVYFVIQAT